MSLALNDKSFYLFSYGLALPAMALIWAKPAVA
jgi:hypothetical protein